MSARSRRLATGVAVLVSSTILLAAAEPAAPAKKPGDQWEVTTEMKMGPMPMPSRTAKVCAPKDWTEPPGGTDERQHCQISDFKLVGGKATWKVKCEGPPPMTGDGEIVRDGTEAFNGTIKMAAEGVSMTIKLNGHRLGDCEVEAK